jgi:HTH-type transcriptional regulator/antitoxin HigA
VIEKRGTTVPSPENFLRRELERRSWSKNDLAFVLGWSDKSVGHLLAGRRPINLELAKTLGAAFSMPAEYFATLQQAYDLSRSRDPDPEVSRRSRLQAAFPIREMLNRGWIKGADPQELETQLLRFFELENLPEPSSSSRTAIWNGGFELTPAQHAWLVRVRQLGMNISVPAYSEAALRSAVLLLRELVPDRKNISKVPGVLTECGVRYVLIETLGTEKIDGACIWLDPCSPLIALSLRSDRLDSYWFTLRHEIEHLLCGHGRGSMFGLLDVDLEEGLAGMSLPEERVANAAATEFCVPQGELRRLVERWPDISERNVIDFAYRFQTHPALVVARIRSIFGRPNFMRQFQTRVRRYAFPNAIVDGWGQIAVTVRDSSEPAEEKA